MPTILYKTLSGRKRAGMSIGEAIRQLTLGEMLQGAAELVAVLTLLVAAVIWLIIRIQPHPEVQVGVALFAYERGATVEGTTKTSLSRMQDLVANCTLWEFPPALVKNHTKVSDLQAAVLTKVLLENVSDEGLTNLRLGVVSRLHGATTRVSAAQNLEVTGKLESTSQDGLHKYVISIATIEPKSSAVLSLQTPMNDNLQRVLSQKHITVRLPSVFLSADQLWNVHPTVTPVDASIMLKRETELHTGEKGIPVAELIERRLLDSSDRELNAEDLSHRLLPTASLCQEDRKTAGEIRHNK
ncbi:MAG: hypothetical protein CAF45_013350 [Nitrospira sp. CG24E]|nr:MAG: hypothetical protein CAF45_013350 [Nitrospira sp. CG24E]